MNDMAVWICTGVLLLPPMFMACNSPLTVISLLITQSMALIILVLMGEECGREQAQKQRKEEK